MCSVVFKLSDKALCLVYRVLRAFVAIVGCGLCFLFIIFSVRHYFYPLKYREEIIRAADEFNIERALVFAVVNVESRFNPKATSSAGAKGLMQITDGTGEYIAEKLGDKEYDLFDIRTSLRFGCYYLRYLIDRFNSVDVAIVAYNAGEGNVREWLNDERYSKDKKTLNVIPFKETKEYLKKIKTSFEKYKNYYKNSLDKR